MWDTVECGFPSQPDVLLIPYADDKKDLTCTIYPHVPAGVIDKVIKLHGGVVEGEMPVLALDDACNST